ncbi:MAG: hypothetical protein HOK64_02295 [Proteobacteria bacterium]|jgi:hypothetical protein|nr:hypothetical protein [Pseudomonadota bacterium]MBT5066389.1 hypothetical protein [Pseudomonadota bacterium]MBT6192002.1 hypothetical protein [Pseudomonadota bacterium]MBT6464533.1 hypothetical protein [Pseudomonadota bacterium]MBT6673757.1 hypothetical protein [Pseudomonadota bacterium]
MNALKLIPITLFALVLGCSQLKIPEFPSVSMPEFPKLDLMSSGGQTATPRPLISARLTNPQNSTQVPKITVGKLVEFAERGHSCQCAGDRFVNEWEKINSGFQLKINSNTLDTVQFSCAEQDERLSCYIKEIDLGDDISPISERYLSGSKFIEEIYFKGRSCARTTPCP